MLLWQEVQQLLGMHKQWELPMEQGTVSPFQPGNRTAGGRPSSGQAPPWGQGCAEDVTLRVGPGWAGLGHSWRLALLQGWCHCHWVSGWAQMVLLGHRNGGKSCSHPSPKQKQNCYVIPATSVCRFWGEHTWRRQCVGKGSCHKGKAGQESPWNCAAAWHPQQHPFHIQWSEIRHQIKNT